MARSEPTGAAVLKFQLTEAEAEHRTMATTQLNVDDDIRPAVEAFIAILKAKMAAPATAEKESAQRPSDELPHQEAASFAGVTSDALRAARRRGLFGIPSEAHRSGRVWFYRVAALRAWREVRSVASGA